MKPKVLVCASTTRHLAHFHLRYLQAFRHAGWAVHTLAQGALDCADVEKHTDLVFEKQLLSLQNLELIFRIVRILRRERYDLICVHTTLAAAICRIALLLSGCRGTRLVYVCHGYFFEAKESGQVQRGARSWFYLLCERLLGRETDLLFLMNQADYRSACRYRLGGKLAFISGMGFDPGRYTMPAPDCRARLREGWGAKEDTRVFLCVGEFSKRKNQKLILEAFAQAIKANADIRLVFAGDGDLQAACAEDANALRLGDAVVFAGYTEEIAQYYLAADALITASKSEGLPFNVLEAQYFGLPVIASRIKGHTDLIDNGKNGLLFDVSDREGLAGCILKTALPGGPYTALKANAHMDDAYLLERTLAHFMRAVEAQLRRREQPLVIEPLPIKAEGLRP